MKLFVKAITACILVWSLFVSSAFAAPPLEEMAGQMLLVGFRGETLPEDHHILRDIREHHLGGVILFNYDVVFKQFGRNITSPEQVRKLTRQLKRACDYAQKRAGLPYEERLPLFIAVDQEGGRVARLSSKNGFLNFPSAQELGSEAPEETEKSFEKMGRMVADAGFNVDFAPVLDVNVNPECPVIGAIGRSFSEEPYAVAVHGRAALRGLRKAGVVGCVKHFPGHGSSRSDSHNGVTDISETWSSEELTPYKDLLATDDIQLLMTGHLFNSRLDPKFPATLSSAVLTGLLRGQLAYDGVIVTDDLQMGAIANEYGLIQTVERAVLAGADILLFGNNLSYDSEIVPKAQSIIVQMVQDGKITRKRLEDSYERIVKVKKSLKDS